LVSLLAGYYRAKSSIVFHHDCTLQNIKKYHLKKTVNGIGAIGARSILEAKQIQGKRQLAAHMNRSPAHL
jgi:DeoR/GlpR family transcriptional regulator of sugar metabolism